MTVRPVQRLVEARPTVEGAGVRLRRAFGFGPTADLDPFLLLDDFRGDRPDDYAAGFPWHPHRGIETITYVLAGEVEHGDSLANRGVVGAGDVQWMTAGRGVIHQEMPRGDGHGRMHGFQLWANLPAALKMTAPRYREVPARDVPVAGDADGSRIRVVCGRYRGLVGPVRDIATDPRYLDVDLPPGVEKAIPTEPLHTAFAYVFAGAGIFCDATAPLAVPTQSAGWAQAAPPAAAGNRTLVLFGTGDEIVVRAGGEGVRFLLVSGRPLREPVAWYGPIVMNTQEELRQAFRDLETGRFLDPRP